MSKDSNAYKGIPIVGQLLSFLPKHIIDSSAAKKNSGSAYRTVSTKLNELSQLLLLQYPIGLMSMFVI